jgi:polyisoprenoid-binding protein YceI
MSDELPALTRVVGGRIVPVAGQWELDGLHTHTGFAIRHLLTLMRGRFREQRGTIVIAEDPLESTVEVVIQAASLDTAHPAADETVRGPRFLEVETHPTIEFRSRSVVPGEDGDWDVIGDLSIKGISEAVTLRTQFLGAVHHPLNGQAKMSFSSTASITREQFGMAGLLEARDGSGVYTVGNRVDLQIDVEADLVG